MYDSVLVKMASIWQDSVQNWCSEGRRKFTSEVSPPMRWVSYMVATHRSRLSTWRRSLASFLTTNCSRVSLSSSNRFLCLALLPQCWSSVSSTKKGFLPFTPVEEAIICNFKSSVGLLHRANTSTLKWLSWAVVSWFSLSASTNPSIMLR